MIKITLDTHAAVLAKQGEKFYIIAPAGSVYATLCVDNTVAYMCITDEDPSRALAATDNRLNNATAVAGFDLV